MEHDAQHSDESETGDKESSAGFRYVGLGSIAIGLILGAAFLGWPLFQASQGAAEITIFRKMIGAGMFAVLTGINLVIFGEKAIDWIPDNDSNLGDIKFSQWTVMAFNLAVLLAGFWYLDKYLDGLGYR